MESLISYNCIVEFYSALEFTLKTFYTGGVDMVYVENTWYVFTRRRTKTCIFDKLLPMTTYFVAYILSLATQTLKIFGKRKEQIKATDVPFIKDCRKSNHIKCVLKRLRACVRRMRPHRQTGIGVKTFFITESNNFL